jgi:hypothetical protein
MLRWKVFGGKMLAPVYLSEEQYQTFYHKVHELLGGVTRVEMDEHNREVREIALKISLEPKP